MRKVFQEKPSPRVVVNESLALLRSLNIDVEGLSFQFPTEYKGAQYWFNKDILVLHEPNWVEETQPHVSWIEYWETVAHELAHRIMYKWDHSVDHGDTFYATLIAICLIWDLPSYVIDEYEDWYHPRNLRAGKQTGGVLMLQMIKNVADGLVKEGELFSNESSVSVPSGQESLGLIESPDVSEIA